MTPQFAIHIISDGLMAAFWMCAPVLILSFLLGIIVNLVQIATAMQDPVFSTVPRLAICFVGFLFLMPWMINHAMGYAIAILGNLGRYAR